MTVATYSRDRVQDVCISTRLPLSYRIIPRRYIALPLGTAPSDSRFCTKADGYTVLYVAPDFVTAFVETVVRDKFTREGQREILLNEITERAWARIETRPRARLDLLDLRNDGCVRLGAPTDAVNARNHAAGRALGQAIHAEHKTTDGFVFSSRLTKGDAYALFDRALSKVEARDSGALPDHPDMPDVLSRYDIRLVTT